MVLTRFLLLFLSLLVLNLGGPVVCGAKPKKSNPLVTMDLGSLGSIEIELFPDMAPNTVHNFIALIKQGYYNGVIFHRVIPGFMIQGGDPTGTGSGGPGYSIKGEFKENGFRNKLKHERGVISMARTNLPDSAGSQFFIMVADAPHLDGAYASFGTVRRGLEITDKVVGAECDRLDRPYKDQIIVKMTVDTFGKEYPEPERL